MKYEHHEIKVILYDEKDLVVVGSDGGEQGYSPYNIRPDRSDI